MILNCEFVEDSIRGVKGLRLEDRSRGVTVKGVCSEDMLSGCVTIGSIPPDPVGERLFKGLPPVVEDTPIASAGDHGAGVYVPVNIKVLPPLLSRDRGIEKVNGEACTLGAAITVYPVTGMVENVILTFDTSIALVTRGEGWKAVISVIEVV